MRATTEADLAGSATAMTQTLDGIPLVRVWLGPQVVGKDEIDTARVAAFEPVIWRWCSSCRAMTGHV